MRTTMRTTMPSCLALVILTASLNACGGGSGADRNAGAGGKGTTGTGGAAAGTGGAGGGAATSYPCTGKVISNPIITDFSDVSADRWGSSGTFAGGKFSYAGGTGTLTATYDNTAKNLHVMGSVVGYAGAGLYFDSCGDASAYKGLQFTIAGSIGTCALELQVQTNSDKKADATAMKGTCTTGCTSGTAKMLAVTGTAAQTIMVPWANLLGAAPSAFDPKELVGIQWQVTTADTCTADFTLDDVKLMN